MQEAQGFQCRKAPQRLPDNENVYPPVSQCPKASQIVAQPGPVMQDLRMEAEPHEGDTVYPAGGVHVTETIVLPEPEPPAPVQVTVKVVFAGFSQFVAVGLLGRTDSEPVGARRTGDEPSVHDVAFVATQLMTDVPS